MAEEESDYDDESEYTDSEDEVMNDDEIEKEDENANDADVTDDDQGVEGTKVDPRIKRMKLAKCLPYEVETLEDMDQKLDYIITKLTVSIEARDWEFGFRTWLSRLTKYVQWVSLSRVLTSPIVLCSWMSLSYPMKKEVRLKLILTLYDVAVIPGFAPGAAAQTTETVRSLLRYACPLFHHQEINH